MRLGQRAAGSLDLAAVLDRELRELGAQTEELVILAAPELSAGLARYVSAIDSPKRLRVTAEMGSAVPLTAGATAKTLLAFAPEAQIDVGAQAPPRASGPRHGHQREAAARPAGGDRPPRLGPELGGDLRRGLGGRRAGAGDDGHAVASIGVAAPISRHSRGREQATRQAVIATAARASARLIGDTTPAPDVQPPSVTGSN